MYSRQCWGANSSAKPECRCFNETALADASSKGRPTIKVLCPVTGWVGAAVSAFLLKIVIEQKLGARRLRASRLIPGSACIPRLGKGLLKNGHSNSAGYPVELVAWERLNNDGAIWTGLEQGDVHIYPEARF